MTKSILGIDPSGEVVEWLMALVLKTIDDKDSKNLTKRFQPCHSRAFLLHWNGSRGIASHARPSN